MQEEVLMKKVLVCAVFMALILPVSAFADGASLFKTKCAACHGPDGTGQTPMGKKLLVKNLGSAEVQKLTDAEMTQVLRKGKMPKSKLSAEDMKLVIAYVRSLKK